MVFGISTAGINTRVIRAPPVWEGIVPLGRHSAHWWWYGRCCCWFASLPNPSSPSLKSSNHIFIWLQKNLKPFFCPPIFLMIFDAFSFFLISKLSCLWLGLFFNIPLVDGTGVVTFPQVECLKGRVTTFFLDYHFSFFKHIQYKKPKQYNFLWNEDRDPQILKP